MTEEEAAIAHLDFDAVPACAASGHADGTDTACTRDDVRFLVEMRHKLLDDGRRTCDDPEFVVMCAGQAAVARIRAHALLTTPCTTHGFHPRPLLCVGCGRVIVQPDELVRMNRQL